MQNQDEIYWGQERVDELLGQVAITKRTTAASEPDVRAQNKELARIQEQPVMRDYYQFMRMRLRSYFDAVSALRSGTYALALSLLSPSLRHPLLYFTLEQAKCRRT